MCSTTVPPGDASIEDDGGDVEGYDENDSIYSDPSEGERLRRDYDGGVFPGLSDREDEEEQPQRIDRERMETREAEDFRRSRLARPITNAWGLQEFYRTLLARP